MKPAFVLCAGLAPVFWPAEAWAHAADRGHVLLLPTGYYLVGGAAAVALSFIVLALVAGHPLQRLASARLPLGRITSRMRFPTSLAAFVLLALLISTGWLGSRDPLSNPLPLVVWTVFWVGLVLAQGLFGNLWWWLDPWYAPWRILSRLLDRHLPARPLPRWIGYWPAILQFLGFAWFELVDPAPDDPARLALAVALYFSANLLLMLIFGHEEWSRRGEALSAFLRIIARMGIVAAEEGRGRAVATARLPGARLADAPPLPQSGALFLLVALGSVSFDGLMRTFAWVGLWGVNPLEFPGRTAMMGINSFGLLMMCIALAAAFFGAVALGARLAGDRGRRQAAGALAWSIIPISMAYHFSHYLTALVINGRYALAALSDPLMNGADLFGTAGMHVRAGTLMGADRAWLVWNLQAAAIIGGHLLAVLVAHAIASRLHERRNVVPSQLPLAMLMVAYTVFGLWLLSSPTAA